VRGVRACASAQPRGAQSSSAGGNGDSSSTLVSAFSVVAQPSLLILLELAHASPAKATADVGALARAWEPDLYGEVGSAGFGLRASAAQSFGEFRGRRRGGAAARVERSRRCAGRDR